MIANVVKVVHVEIKDGKRTETELTGEELEQWKKEHGYGDTEKESQSDTE